MRIKFKKFNLKGKFKFPKLNVVDTIRSEANTERSVDYSGTRTRKKNIFAHKIANIYIYKKKLVKKWWRKRKCFVPLVLICNSWCWHKVFVMMKWTTTLTFQFLLFRSFPMNLMLVFFSDFSILSFIFEEFYGILRESPKSLLCIFFLV